MEIKIVNKSQNELPAYSTIHSAGMDLRANLNEHVVLKPLERKLIPTGLFIELPVGYEAQIIKPSNTSEILKETERVAGFDKITIVLDSKETGEIGKGEAFVRITE